MHLTHRNVYVLSRWAGTGDLDGLSIRAVDGTIAITRSGRVDSGLESEWRCESSDGCSIRSAVRRCVVGRGGIVGEGRIFGRRSSIVGRRSVVWGGISSMIDRLLQSSKFCRHKRAALSRTVQVLDGDSGSSDPPRFILLRIACWESDLDRWIIYCEPSLNVLDQSLENVR